MVSSDLQVRLSGLSSLIGNTPLFTIKTLYENEERTIYAKAEHLNLTGSVKDRMAFHIIQRGYQSGALKPGAPIIEATSGNTGISFAAIGRTLGHPVIIFMPDWLSSERINLIKSLGASIELVSKEEGGFKSCIQLSEELAEKTNDAFLPSQFSNEHNVEAHYLTTGPEIWWQLGYRSLQPDAFIAGVGTGGTIMGAGQFLKENNPNIKIHPLEPTNSPTLSTGYKVGKHRIEGILDEFIPPILNLDNLDDVIGVDDGDAIIMAQKLASELGIGVGISSGANFLGALQVQNELGRDAVVVTVFSDDNKKYLSTDLLREEPLKDNYLSPKIKLLGCIAYKRTCHTCCNPSRCDKVIDSICDVNSVLPQCPRRS